MKKSAFLMVFGALLLQAQAQQHHRPITFNTPDGDLPGNTVMRRCGVYHGTSAPPPTGPCCRHAMGGTEDHRSAITALDTEYCIPTSANSATFGDFVNSVVMGSINNVNSGALDAPAYTDFSEQWSTSMLLGQNHSIVIQSGEGYPNVLVAWIDYDQNSIFTPDEKLGQCTVLEPGGNCTISFTVPNSATPGGTRLRVRAINLSEGEPVPADPCFDYSRGETEDYGITIIDPPVCIPNSLSGTWSGDFINGVSLGSIVNLNSGGTGVPHYTDHAELFSTDLALGQDHSISIQGGSFAPNHYAAWIDHNQDNVFDESEKLGEWTSSNPWQTQSIDFTVPMNATLGTTRLRVRGVFHYTGSPNPIDPCFSYNWGETEDYSVVITTSVGIGSSGRGPIVLYPNPTAGNLTVDLPEGQPTEAQVLDLTGRVIMAGLRLEGRNDLSMGTLASGRYILRCLLPEGPLSLPFQVVR